MSDLLILQKVLRRVMTAARTLLESYKVQEDRSWRTALESLIGQGSAAGAAAPPPVWRQCRSFQYSRFIQYAKKNSTPRNISTTIPRWMRLLRTGSAM